MEYEYNEPVKKGHGLLALLLGIFSIVITILVGILFGMFGLVPAAILAILAIVLGVLSIRGGNHGKGGIITGTIGIIFALMFSGFVLSIGAFLKTEEVRTKIPTLSAYADESWRGIAGLILKMRDDGVDMDKINAEVEYFNNSTGTAAGNTDTAGGSADAAPAVSSEVSNKA